MPFSKNPKLQKNSSDESVLIEAYWEHQIRELYSEYLTAVLKPLSHDELEFYRKMSLNVMEHLIEMKPE